MVGAEVISADHQVLKSLHGNCVSVPLSGAVDGRSLYERERLRRVAAEGRCAELVCLETAARREVRNIRRTAKEALRWREEVARLTWILEQADIESRKRSTIETLRNENGALRSIREKLSKTAFGKKNEQQEKPRSKKKRGHCWPRSHTASVA